MTSLICWTSSESKNLEVDVFTVSSWTWLVLSPILTGKCHNDNDVFVTKYQTWCFICLIIPLEVDRTGGKLGWRDKPYGNYSCLENIHVFISSIFCTQKFSTWIFSKLDRKISKMTSAKLSYILQYIYGTLCRQILRVFLPTLWSPVLFLAITACRHVSFSGLFWCVCSKTAFFVLSWGTAEERVRNVLRPTNWRVKETIAKSVLALDAIVMQVLPSFHNRNVLELLVLRDLFGGGDLLASDFKRARKPF